MVYVTIVLLKLLQIIKMKKIVDHHLIIKKHKNYQLCLNHLEENYLNLMIIIVLIWIQIKIVVQIVLI